MVITIPKGCPIAVNETLLRIDTLRTALYQLVEEVGGNLSHPSVVAASQQLDLELARWQHGQHEQRVPLRLRMAAG
jgi:Spo0E like sporulation regulatory protein